MLNKVPSHGVLHPVKQPVRFAGEAEDRRAARKASKDELEAMLGGNLKEGPMQQIARGFAPLNFIQQIVGVKFTPAQKRRLDAYADLIRMALRDKRTATPQSEAVVMSKLKNPTPELAEWMDKYNVTAEDFKEPVADYVKIDQDAWVPPEVWTRLAKIGGMGLKVPVEHGGHGFKQREYDVINRSLARTTGAIAGAISAHSTIGGALKLGTKEQQAKYYPSLAKGEYMAAFALTEPNAGTDVARMGTTARLSDDKKNWVVNGEKIYITNTHRSGIMYLFAKTDMGVHSQDRKKQTAFVIELPFRNTDTHEEMMRKKAELAKQGMIISDPLNLMMIRGSSQAHIQFRNFKIPYENVLGGESKIGAGLGEPFNALNAGRAGFGPAYSESANILFENSVQRAKTRPMFKDYGGMQKDLPAIRDTIATMAMKRAALQAFSDFVTSYIDQHEDEGYNIIAEAAAVKVLSTVDNWKIADDAVEVYGGAGLMKEHPDGVERAFRDARIGLTVEGVTNAMKQLAMGTAANRLGKELLNGRVDILLANRLKGRLQTGGLDYMDARWLHSRARRLNNKIIQLGAKHATLAKTYQLAGKKYPGKMETDQRNLLRMFDVNVGILALACVQMQLKHNPDLPKADRTALESYVTVARKDIDKSLREIKLWNRMDDLKEAVAGAYLDAPKNEG